MISTLLGSSFLSLSLSFLSFYVLQSSSVILCVEIVNRERRRTGNVIKSTYVLPDGVTHTKGYLKDPQSANNFLTLGLSDEGPNSVMDKVDGEKKKADMNKNVKKKNSPFSSLCVEIFVLKLVWLVCMQEIDLTNERFLVPETLFHPADLGLFSHSTQRKSC